ncbi:hypothetical protein LJC59_06985 [Desulfovibrio sp. OttesenSCG-928-A18]|nr:hypothetical protein [Desulfovibrio sp. OttesenSCG-928-A18]
MNDPLYHSYRAQPVKLENIEARLTVVCEICAGMKVVMTDMLERSSDPDDGLLRMLLLSVRGLCAEIESIYPDSNQKGIQ